jgi:hypothetical protein
MLKCITKEENQQKGKKSIYSLLFSWKHVTNINIAKDCGKIISMIPAFGNICQIMTKHMHVLIHDN